MRKLYSLLLVLVLFPSLTFADVVEIDGINYNIIKKAKRAEVANGSYKGTVVIPATVEYDGVTCNVEAIQENAFNWCDHLESLTIPNSVITIGKNAFSYCKALTSVNIPDGVTVIEPYTFYCCDKLTSVTLPSEVTSIGEYAFWSSGIMSVNIPETVSTIGKNAFQDCEDLLSISIPDNVTSIGSRAFSGCKSLNSLSIGNGIKLLPEYVLYNCSSLESVEIGSGVEEIEWYAFYGSGLKSIVIPDNVKTISGHIFEKCENLASVTIGSGLSTIERYMFASCNSLSSITIPGNITKIGEGAFTSCTSLETVNFEEGLETIESTFSYCEKLTSVTFPKSLVSVEGFNYCSNLSTVLFQKGVESIVGFSNCKELADVYCLNIFPAEANFQVFEKSDINYATLHVPDISIDLYKNSEDDVWKKFGNIVALKAGDPGFVEPTGTPIIFEDSWTKLLCIQYTDDNGDQQVSEEEAAALTKWEKKWFAETTITKFDEFKYYTGLTEIPEYAFDCCDELTTITVPANVETIAEWAFNDNEKLQRIILPANLKSLRTTSFQGCESLTEVYSYATTVPTCEVNTFLQIGYTATLYVPAGTKAAYSTANEWKRFSKIIEMGTNGIEKVRNIAFTAEDYYTLDGRRIEGQPTQKGLYIVNGRKVVMK